MVKSVHGFQPFRRQRFFPKTFKFDILISIGYILKVKKDRYFL